MSNWLELAEFLCETYQHTPRQKLPERMKDASDFHELNKLSQKDLAITYCERVGGAGSKSDKSAA